jgi:hypothetical protein
VHGPSGGRSNCRNNMRPGQSPPRTANVILPRMKHGTIQGMEIKRVDLA